VNIKQDIFGKLPDGNKVYIFTLSSDGITAKISNFGATLISLTVPDKNNKLDDIVLGYKNLEGYIRGKFFFGGTIGRNANRIKNAEIEINGKKYNLTKNEGENQLHGGIKGFNKALWTPRPYLDSDGNQCIELSYLSKDGEEGYPGNLKVKVIYSIQRNNELKIDYFAVCDKDTVVNLTNHSYFNLRGHASGNILNHEVMINADKFTVNDKDSIPTGEIRDVENTPMDLRNMTKIEKNIYKKYDQLVLANGYDSNWIINKNGKNLCKAAEAFEPCSRRCMEVYTTSPGIQFYTGNYINESKNCKDNAVYNKNSGLCFETQYFPDALNHNGFPSTILRKGEKYKHTTIYRFTIK
jgi:aldose 1-epimerase